MNVFDDLTLQEKLFLIVHSKKKVSDQASVCAQKEDKEWQYQKKSIAGDLVKARLKTHLFISALISMIVSVYL